MLGELSARHSVGGIERVREEKELSLERWLMFSPEGADINTHSVNYSLQWHKGISTEEKSEITALAK